MQGQTALAQGLTAQRGDTEVQALSYYFQAANYDSNLTEAASRVNILSANITSGNMGQNIRNDIVWRDQWTARLAEAEQVYADNVKGPTPYYLVYDYNIQQGTVDYNNRTVNINGITIDLGAELASQQRGTELSLRQPERKLYGSSGTGETGRQNYWEYARYHGWRLGSAVEK